MVAPHPIPSFQFSAMNIQDKTKTYITVGHSEGIPSNLKGKTPFTPYGVSLRALWFLPTIPLPGRGIPPRNGDS